MIFVCVIYIFFLLESILINSYFPKKIVHLFGHFHLIGTEFNTAFSCVPGYVILNRTEAGVAGWYSGS